MKTYKVTELVCGASNVDLKWTNSLKQKYII